MQEVKATKRERVRAACVPGQARGKRRAAGQVPWQEWEWGQCRGHLGGWGNGGVGGGIGSQINFTLTADDGGPSTDGGAGGDGSGDTLLLRTL